MKTTRFISLMLFAALFTLLSSCGKEDLSMESDISAQKMANASQFGSSISPINSTIDALEIGVGVPVQIPISGYTQVESMQFSVSWKSKYNPPLTIVQTEADYLKLFNGPANWDFNNCTIIAIGFTYRVGFAIFGSRFYFKNDDPRKCLLFLDDVYAGTPIQEPTPMSVAIRIPKMYVTEVEISILNRYSNPILDLLEL